MILHCHHSGKLWVPIVAGKTLASKPEKTIIGWCGRGWHSIPWTQKWQECACGTHAVEWNVGAENENEAGRMTMLGGAEVDRSPFLIATITARIKGRSS